MSCDLRFSSINPPVCAVDRRGDLALFLFTSRVSTVEIQQLISSLDGRRAGRNKETRGMALCWRAQPHTVHCTGQEVREAVFPAAGSQGVVYGRHHPAHEAVYYRLF